MPDASVFTIRSETNIKKDAYVEFLHQLNDALARQGDYAILVVDGDPRNVDPTLRNAHRDLVLRDRRILEDARV